MAADPEIIAGVDEARVRNTLNVETTGQVALELEDISPVIYTKNGDANPFSVLLETIPRKQSGWNDTHSWYEDVLLPQKDHLDGSLAQGATSFIVANGKKFSVNDTIWIRDADAEGWVTAVSGNTLTVTWIAPAGGPAAGVALGASIVRIGNANRQDSTQGIAPTTKETQEDNYFQDMRHVVAASLQHLKGKYRVNPGDWENQLKKKGEEHEIEKEKTLLFGQAAAPANLGGNSPVAFSRGLYYFNATYRTVLGAALTRTTWDDFVVVPTNARVMGQENWWCFCSGRIQRQVSQFGYPYHQVSTGAQEFGINVTKYLAPNGKTITMKAHPLFNTHGWDDLAILVNVSGDNLAYVYHSDMDTRQYEATIPYNRSARETMYKTVFCLECKGEDVNTAVLEDVHAV